MRNQRIRIFSAALAALLALCALAPAQDAPAPAAAQPAETREQRDARMKWWREARFGMFIHWGIYSVPAGTWQGNQVKGIGEWIMNRGKIPVADYAKFAAEFNPVKFNADEWVATAKAAGMKYIVITSKHHDGFAMFHSATSPYNIYDATPFKRDPLKELAAACEKQGIRLGFYYSQAQDWHHPGGAASGGHWDPAAQDGSMDDYLDKIAVPQVKEILSNYGKISVLWFDTPNTSERMTPARVAKFLPLLKLQPGIIVNNRLGEGFPGDSETPEQFIPATGFPGGRDWETCMTMNDTWGFKSYDNNWKSADDLIRKLVDIASKGGNFLLNVGPTSLGQIPQPSIERLKAVGKWMDVNSEAIYDTSASPFKRLEWGRATQKPGKLFLHVFDWPADGKLVVPMKNTIKKAYLLADPARTFPCTAGEQGVTVMLTGTAPDPVASVIVAEIAGAVDVMAQDNTVVADTAGKLVLDASDAEIVGATAKLETSGNRQNIGYWTNPGDYVKWKVKVATPGTYQVSMNYACQPGSEGSAFTLSAGDKTLDATVKTASQGWTNYRTAQLGTVAIDKAGTIEITLKPKNKTGVGVMNLRAITLAPAADKLRVLIVDGQNNHNWKATTPVLKAMLEKTGRFQVQVATAPPKKSPPEAWAKFRPAFKDYKAVVLNYNDYGGGDQWPAEVQKAMIDYMAGGGGLVLFHAANNAFPKWAEWNKIIALNWQPNTFGEALKIVDGKVVHVPKGTGAGAGHAAQHEYEVQLLDKDDPITKGMPARWQHVKDELYHGQRGPAENVHVLAYAFDDPATTAGQGTGNNEPLVYTVTYGKGRTFVDLMGHDAPQAGQPDMAALLTRGTEWAATGQVTLPLPEGFKAKE